uniref:Electrin-2.2 n=1 Tax=Litoria rubella TaxID=104895 RepID=EI22_LITRU|nr:RecName: Full=Electrin-2.2 [Litoria rubella]
NEEEKVKWQPDVP